MLLLMMLLTTTTAWAWSGSGTSADPYKIANANDLIQLATDVNGGKNYSGKYFKQTAPITLTGNWTPIGTSSKPFMGKYDGDNKTISGLTISGSYQYAGLFGFTNGTSDLNSCTLKNIVVKDCNIDVSGTTESYAGGISGYATDYTHIINCRVSGTIKAKTNAGGIAGYLWTTTSGNVAWISQCFTDVTVAATYKGKLFGRGTTGGSYDKSVFNSKISYYHADGSGVTAFGEGDDVEYSVPICTFSGVPSGVTMATTNAAVTYNDTPYYATGTKITLTVDDANQVFNTFSVSGATYSVADDKKSATITVGSSDVTVSATLMAISGTSNGVTWSMSDSDSNGTYDRLTLSGSGTLSTSPWDADFASSITRVDISSADIAISGNPFSTLADGVDIVAPTPAYAVSYASAAFAGKLRVALGNYLFTATNEEGTPAYAITSDIDLLNLASAVKAGNSGKGKTFRQTGNITFNNISFVPIGIDPTKCFSGTYDGGGYTISGLQFDFLENIYTYGLFGYVKNGLVENVRLDNPSVNGDYHQSYYYCGALIGVADGTNGASTTIRNCVVISPEINASGNWQGAIIGA